MLKRLQETCFGELGLFQVSHAGFLLSDSLVLIVAFFLFLGYVKKRKQGHIFVDELVFADSLSRRYPWKYCRYLKITSAFNAITLPMPSKERIAYVAGNSFLASTLADSSDLEFEVDLFDDILDRTKEESFESGKDEGMGIDTAEVIDDLELQVKTLKEQHSSVRNDLEAVRSWFESDASKTVAGRKKCVSEIRRRLLTIPRY